MKLIIIILLSLLAIIHIIFTKKSEDEFLKNLSLSWSFIILSYFFLLIINFEELNNFQNHVLFSWINNLSLINWGNIFLSMDGISMYFIGLSIILIPICIIINWDTINYLKKEFSLILFVVLFLLINVFLVLDIIAFYILFEIILIPIFLMIGLWGSGEKKSKAAYYFFFYTMIGSLLMLLSIFKLYSLTGTTNYINLLNIVIPTKLQIILFIGVFSSFAVKIPMMPIHIWLPLAHVEAPISGSILLAGILLKLGGYGFIRLAFPILPNASIYFSPIIISLSIIAIIYGASTTLRQSDIKRLIAYSSVSHMGLVTLSIFTHSIQGLIASLCMMLAHGLASSALFISSVILYNRHHTRIIKYYKGLTTTMPIFSTITMILILANIGLPLTFNFIAEFLSILSAFQFSFLTGILTCLGALITTVYTLFFYNRIFFGFLSKNIKFSRDLMNFEFHSFIPFILLIIILGLYPNLIINNLIFSSLINITI